MRPKHRVIVLVFAHQPNPCARERLAFQQCYRILAKHPIRLVCPRGMDVSAYRAIAPHLEPDFIKPGWLASVKAYNRLKILPWIYRRYAAYEFMLTYELDAFVFRDDLEYWCNEGWDYIGAPWFEGYYNCAADSPPAGVGNSGFSLRRIASMLRVIRTFRYQRPVSETIARWRNGERTAKQTIADLSVRNNFWGPLNDYGFHEDLFWCQIAARRFPWLKIAPYEAARRFSFEANPRRLFSECGDRLPFGCHKWAELDPLFWRDHVSAVGTTAPALPHHAQ